jgi:hypothetical protein
MKNVLSIGILGIIIILLITIIIGVCYTKIERFTAPGLTLTKPPSWFPQYAAKAYNPEDWKTRMYLERYPFRINNNGENCDNRSPDYISSGESDLLASTYRMWRN